MRLLGGSNISGDKTAGKQPSMEPLTQVTGQTSPGLQGFAQGSDDFAESLLNLVWSKGTRFGAGFQGGAPVLQIPLLRQKLLIGDQPLGLDSDQLLGLSIQLLQFHRDPVSPDPVEVLPVVAA